MSTPVEEKLLELALADVEQPVAVRFQIVLLCLIQLQNSERLKLGG